MLIHITDLQESRPPKMYFKVLYQDVHYEKKNGSDPRQYTRHVLIPFISFKVC